MLTFLLLHPVRVARLVLTRLLDETVYLALQKLQPGVKFCRGAKVRGWPLIEPWPGATIVVEEGAILNSRNRGYHVNMHSPVKLLADRKGATIRIGARTRMHGVCVHATSSVTIGRNCLIAANTQIMDSSGHDLLLERPELRLESKGSSSPVTIGDNVWIGSDCIILPGVTIGDGSVVAAGSVVTGNVPPRAVVGGVPARVIRQLSAEEQRQLSEVPG